MSLTREVAALIDEIGSGTADDLLPHFDGRTRAQVRAALKAAWAAGLIDSDGRQRNPNRPHRATGRPRGSLPTTYRRIKKEPAHQRIASVWDLAKTARPMNQPISA
jgi:hypothetical protein